MEASDWRSGALITARHALDQGRDVYAVPGPIDAPQSQSCNELIAKGEAALLTSPTVLVREYSGMMPEQAVQQAFRRQTGEYPEPAARSAWEDIRRREQQAEQRRAAAAEKAKAEPKQPSAAAKPLPDGLNEDEKTIVTLSAGRCEHARGADRPLRSGSAAGDEPCHHAGNGSGFCAAKRADSSSAPGDKQEREEKKYTHSAP